jgi:hypothetical protein
MLRQSLPCVEEIEGGKAMTDEPDALLKAAVEWLKAKAARRENNAEITRRE